MDVNEDSVAPWNGHVVVVVVGGGGGGGDGLEDGRCWCAEDDVDDDGGGAGSRSFFGMKDVTTATGCAVSRRSARILWESSRALLCWFARSKEEEDQRLAVASASAERDMGLNSLSDFGRRNGAHAMFGFVRAHHLPSTPFLTDDISMIT